MGLLGHACHALRAAATGLLRTAGWIGEEGPHGLPGAMATGMGQSQAVVTKQEIWGPSYMVRVQGHPHHSHSIKLVEYSSFIKK